VAFSLHHPVVTSGRRLLGASPWPRRTCSALIASLTLAAAPAAPLHAAPSASADSPAADSVQARGRARLPLTVASPDGRVTFVLQQGAQGGLIWRVTLDDRPAIEASPLAFTLDEVVLTRNATVGEVTRTQAREAYPWRGVHATAVSHYNGVRAAVTHQPSKTTYTLDIRAFNDGVAFRHLVPAADGPRTPDETTAFTLPAGSTVWLHSFDSHYESAPQKVDAAALTDQFTGPPLTVKLPQGRGYVAITEGGLDGYSGMGLQAAGANRVDVRLGHAQPVNYPFRLRYGLEEATRLQKPAAMTGAITTPWRVVLVGRDLNALVNADVIHNVSAPPDRTLFPDGMRTPWVKPGRSLWRYLDGGDNSLAGMKEFSRLAGELGFEYSLLEGFWQKWPESDLIDLVEYSKQRHVGIWLWKHSKELRDPAKRKEFFDICTRTGVVGAKIDFFDHEHKEVIDLYHTLLREAAKRRLMLDFHGANKPAGESRTWPNEMTREAIFGLEHRKVAAWGPINTALPFTRMLAGHADFTPVIFGERRQESSWAHQIATAAVYTSPLLIYGAHPKALLENPAVEMIKSIPATWDETRVLSFSEIGEVAGFARRTGDTWFVAILNGATARAVSVPLTFLGGGSYQGLLVRDRADDPAAVDVARDAASRLTTLTVDLRVGGGFIGRFTPGAASSVGASSAGAAAGR